MHSTTTASVKVDLELLNNRIIETLLELGLTNDEASILLFMNKKGEMGASEIAKRAEIPRTRMYLILESLQKKGLVFSTIERPAKFKALTLDRAVDFLIQSFRHKLDSLEKAKKVISHDWLLLQEHEVVTTTEVSNESIQTISGEDRIYSKVKDMIILAKKEVVVIANERNLAKISYEEITDELQHLASNSISVKVLTNTPSHQVSLLEEISKCEIKEIPPGFNDKMHFIIVDNEQLLLMNLEEGSAIWTNSRSFVDAMRFLFSVGWRSPITCKVA